MKQIFLINPVAGTGRLVSIMKTIRSLKQDEDEIIYTRKPKDALDIVPQYPHCRIYAIGGDGTLNEVVNGLLDSQELIVIPNGTGNDFSRSIYEEQDPIKALKYYVGRKSQPVDILSVNGHRYINSACFGLDSDTANRVHYHTITKFLPHKFAYVVGALIEYFKYPYNEVLVKIDGKEVYHGKVTLFAINNGKYYGGGLSLTYRAKIDDGLMDVCIVKKKSKWIIPFYIPCFLQHRLDQKSFCIYQQAKEVEVHMKEVYACNVDGEIIEAKDFYFKVEGQAKVVL